MSKILAGAVLFSTVFLALSIEPASASTCNWSTLETERLECAKPAGMGCVSLKNKAPVKVRLEVARDLPPAGTFLQGKQGGDWKLIFLKPGEEKSFDYNKPLFIYFAYNFRDHYYRYCGPGSKCVDQYAVTRYGGCGCLNGSCGE